MSRRALTLMVAGFLTLLFGVVGAVLPVPYVVLSPGPTENTIGDIKGKPVISIEGHETYPASGMLSLVTVAYQGGPGNRIDLFSALRGWVDPTVAVVPEETIFPPTSTAEEVEQRNTQEMTNSQDDATAAALSELKIPYTAVVSVASVQKGLPADGKFKSGDEIVSVNGVRAVDRETISATVRKQKPGQTVTFVVKRGGQSTTLAIPTAADTDGTSIVGITMQIKYRFPFKVKINVGDVGGPSAGMMFSLGIMDKLTPGSMTGGQAIAGTGTITAEGEVGPIGGIQQKMVGARRSGATVFLTPAANCAEAVKAIPDGLKLIKVKTLHDAVQAIDVVRTGSGTAPSCSAG
ncbi:PDZ domain-containing protein [Streptosporangium sp. NPDC087985]|uniref:YlbL family protein n=1 Tax=Streptosporangium sp. NPDC087985 TaxID=3366196 RepID=UPI0037FC459B